MSFTLASIALLEGDLAESHRRLIECLSVSAEIGFVELTGYAFGLAAELALRLDALEEAALLIGACRARFAQVGGEPNVREAEREARVTAALEAKLDGAAAVFDRGAALRPDEALALALGLDARSG
jgi:hypothetical protein